MATSEKLNLGILRNHIMKNFQVRHGQCDRITIPQNIFFLKALSNYYTFTLLTARFFTFDRSWNLATNLS